MIYLSIKIKLIKKYLSFKKSQQKHHMANLQWLEAIKNVTNVSQNVTYKYEKQRKTYIAKGNRLDI